ncbi:MAG: hypothetical protein KC620_23965, partial [Myxococcales bacterium]|nr:hypothetical protein [Myxococcales bacterium]
DGGIADAIIRRQFSLANIIGKHGFDDGVAIPRLNAGADEAFDAIEAAVTAVRLPGSLEWHESHHNPIRWSPKVPMDAEQKTRLAATHVEFWALNVPLLQDDAFWAE